VVTFASGRTNILQGAVHLLLFAAYLLLIFEG
jgi:Ca2+:H+ antiporter